MALISLESAPDIVRAHFDTLRPQVDAALASAIPDLAGPQSELADAMRHAVLAGGKRIRPILCILTAQAEGATVSAAMPAALAVELLHAYTLVHDDLPCMDDDQERRGLPTVHVKYSESTAVLTGDALLTLAFGTLATLPPDVCQRTVSVLANRAGARALLAGQWLDLAQHADPEEVVDLAEINRLKTGALFAAAAEMGAIAAGATAARVGQWGAWGLAFGLAFQWADDVDDAADPGIAKRARAEFAKQMDAVATLSEKMGLAGTSAQDLVEWFNKVRVAQL